ncbi:MAG: hypothetical protein DBW62_00675 [Microbacterium sp.]|nr:MAG: hypothetical protein DBW62_00675 [Microbacterium sp.]
MKRNAFGQLIPASPFLRFTGTGGDGGGGGSEYTPPATQEDLDKIIQDRVSRAERQARADERSKFPDYDSHKEKASKWDAHEANGRTDEEKAEGRVAELEQRIEQLTTRADKAESDLLNERAQTAFKSALNGRVLDADAAFGLDRSQFIKDGKVDTDAIDAWVTANSTEAAKTRVKTPGQGDRDANATGSSVQSGRDLFDSEKKPSRKE